MTNVYRIGVNIAMASNGSALLGVLGRNLMGVNAKVSQLGAGFSRLKLAIGGVVAIGAGLAIIGAWKAPLDEARKFEVAVAKFSTFGLGPQRTQEAAQFAKAMDIAGSSYVDNMHRMAEAQGVFRDSGLSGEAALRGAKMAAPLLAKIAFANSTLDDESQARMNTSALAMMRFVEMRGGVNSPEQFNSIADAGFKAIRSSNGNVNWDLYRQFMATGGVAAQGLSNTALFGEFEPVIGELKSRAGTGLMTAFNRLTGITRVPNQIAHELVKQGLWDGSKITWNSMGGIKTVNGNPLKDSAGFGSDPFQWYMKNVVPMYDRMGLSAADRNREDAMIGGRTGGMMFSIFRRQSEAINKSVTAQQQQFGIDTAYGAAGGTLNGKILQAQKDYANLMERLGEAVLPMANKALSALIPIITGMTKWIAANPGKLAAFAKATLILGTGLVGLGAVAVAVAAFAAVAAAGPVGVTIAAIAGIGSALGAFVALNWGAITGAFANLKTLIGGFLNWLIHGDGKAPSVAQIQANPQGIFGASAVPPPSGKHVQVATTVNMDGRTVAKIVSNHQAAAANRPAPGNSDFDGRMAMAVVGAGGAF